jgi:hypothetical protein
MRKAELARALPKRPRREPRLTQIETPGAATGRRGGEDCDAVRIPAPIAHHEERRSFEPEAEARIVLAVRG